MDQDAAKLRPDVGADLTTPAHSPITVKLEDKPDRPHVHCPRCVGQLEPVSYEGVDLDICRLCRGLWFDQGELAKFNKFDADFPLGPGKTVKGKHSGGKCPRCGVTMTVIQYAPRASFEVDCCGDCKGVWLDAGEIRKIQQILTDEVKLWSKIRGRLDEVVLRERDLWEKYNAELAKREAATEMSRAGWLFLFLTKLPREVYNPVHGFPKVTVALILVNVFIFLLMKEFLAGPSLLVFFLTYGFVPDQFRHMQHIWTLLTSMFLHGSLTHLAGNMYFLYTFGDNVEDVLGHWKFLGLYCLCGVAAILVHFATHMDSFMPTIGASGAISGILGAYSFLFRHRKLYFFAVFLPLKLAAMWYLLFWLGFQILAASRPLPVGRGSVAYLAHIGGFVAGVIFMICYCAWKRHALSRSPSVRALPTASV